MEEIYFITFICNKYLSHEMKAILHETLYHYFPDQIHSSILMFYHCK